MTAITIRLVGEQEDCLFEGLEVDTEILYVDLKKRIEKVTSIPLDSQQVKFRGDELPVVEHPIRTAQFGEELLVVHALLPQWKNYLARVEEFRGTGTENRLKKKERAFEANEKARELYEANFFSAYSTFDAHWLRMRKEYETFLDHVPICIKEATKSFFTRKFSGESIDVDCKDKPSGTQSGAVCIVSFDDTRRVFYVKTLSVTPPLNIIDLYIYKLLEVLKVGAVVQFIPDVVDTQSNEVVYVCSEEIVAFKTLVMLEENWDDFERKADNKRGEIARAIVQLSLLAQVLGLDDLNPENIGFNETNFSLFIVDFRIGFIDVSVAFEDINRPKTLLSLVAQLKMNLGRFSDFVKDMSYEEQLKIGKESIAQWELSSKLDVAFGKLEEEEDSLFATGTETLKEYIDVVREKINLIRSL